LVLMMIGRRCCSQGALSTGGTAVEFWPPTTVKTFGRENDSLKGGGKLSNTRPLLRVST
jgi:hypothetical protein